MATNTEIATEIANQLGGTRRLVAMIGAKHFIAIERGLTFQHMKGTDGAMFTRITLDKSDTYTVEIGKLVKRCPVILHKLEGIYNDNLREVIERRLGLHLSLGTLGR